MTDSERMISLSLIITTGGHRPVSARDPAQGHPSPSLYPLSPLSLLAMFKHKEREETKHCN